MSFLELLSSTSGLGTPSNSYPVYLRDCVAPSPHTCLSLGSRSKPMRVLHLPMKFRTSQSRTYSWNILAKFSSDVEGGNGSCLALRIVGWLYVAHEVSSSPCADIIHELRECRCTHQLHGCGLCRAPFVDFTAWTLGLDPVRTKPLFVRNILRCWNSSGSLRKKILGSLACGEKLTAHITSRMGVSIITTYSKGNLQILLLGTHFHDLDKWARKL